MKLLVAILLTLTTHFILIKCESEELKENESPQNVSHDPETPRRRNVEDLKRLQMEALEKDLLKDVGEMIREFVEMTKIDKQMQAAVSYLLTPEWQDMQKKLRARPEYDTFMKIVRAIDVVYRTVVAGNRLQKWLEILHKDFIISRNITKPEGKQVKPSLAHYFNSPSYRKHKQKLLNNLATLKQLLGSRANESKVRDNFERLWSYVRTLPEYRKVKNTLRLLGVNIEGHLPVIRLELLIASVTA